MVNALKTSNVSQMSWSTFLAECASGFTTSLRKFKKFFSNHLKLLVNILTRSEHLKKEISNENSQNDIAHKWVDAVIWKYCDLDKEPEDRWTIFLQIEDKNTVFCNQENCLHHRFVSRHELFPLRAPLLSMEPCISEFLSKCDSNSDHKITLKEWGHCLGAKDGKLDKIKTFHNKKTESDSF